MVKSTYAHIFNQEDRHPANLGSQILHDKFTALKFFAQHTGQPFVILQRFLVVFHAESLTGMIKLGIKTVSHGANTVEAGCEPRCPGFGAKPTCSGIDGRGAREAKHINIQATPTWGNLFSMASLTAATVESLLMSMVMGRPRATEGGLVADDIVKETMLRRDGSHAGSWAAAK